MGEYGSRTTPPELALVPETEGILWTVRHGLTVYLMVARPGRSQYDVHRVSGGAVDWVGFANSQANALEQIQGDIAG